MVLCLGVVSMAAFAQRDPHAVVQNGKVSLESMFSNQDNARVKELFENGAAIERKVAQAQAQAQAVQPAQTSVENRDGHQDIPSAPVVHSDRPSYYANEEAYQICSAINICDTWVREQTENNLHFQVVSAQLSPLPDAHNQRLEVRYVEEADEKVQVFEEYFGSWKQME